MLNTPLFVSKKEFFVALGGLCVIAFIFLSIEFYQYRNFLKTSLHVSKATILNHYQKTNAQQKTYDVLKLKLDSGQSLYTVSWKPLHVSLKERVKIKFELKSLSFVEYLKGFFVPSQYVYAIYEDNPPFDIRPWYAFVTEQHEEEMMAEFYSALLFATPLSKALRENVQKWGITHLIAISGYNVGVISFLLFMILNPVYTFFQSRYFPYRNKMADLMPIVFAVLIGYMALIDYIPPFMRAVVMSIVGFFLFSRGIKLLSFEILFLVACGLLAFIPSLFFSLSFWFSLSGVFYLFLFLHHVKWKNKLALFIGLDIYVFVTMMPIVHSVFPVFTLLQLSSVFWSAVFIFFYPFGLFLHLIGQGGLLDSWIMWLLHVEITQYTLSVPYWFLVPYTLISILSIKFQKLFIVCFFLALSSLGFIQ